MPDPYYTEKVKGGTHMIEWITATNISFKDFCMKNKMEHMLFSGYIPYMENMRSDEERMKFVTKQITKCDIALKNHLLSIENNTMNYYKPNCCTLLDG